MDESGHNSELFVSWYQKPGTPKVSITDSWHDESKSYSMRLEQQNEIFEIPLFIEFFDSSGKKLNLPSPHIQTNSDGQKLILLKTATLNLKWDGLKARPIVSLLRNFSAPINISWARPLEDFYFLALNDDDTFNRNESLQLFWLNSFKNLYHNLILENQKDATTALKPLAKLLQSILENENLEEKVKAKLLGFPSQSVMMQFMGFLDATGFSKTETALKSFIGAQLKDSLQKKVYMLIADLTKLESISDQYNQDVAAKRELKINLSDLLMSGCSETQFYNSKNFTSVLFQFSAKLKLLQGEDRKKEIENFHSQWKHEPLVLNKWLQTISTSDHPETFETIQWICEKGYFNPENPNQVYSLLRNFGNNLFYFHQSNTHYDFFLNKLAEIDAFNPQVAARMATCLQVVSHLPEEKKNYLSQVINKMTTSGKLSRNSFEVLSKLG